MSAMSYTDRLVAWHESVGPDHPIWAYNAKSAARELSNSLGVRVPEVLTGPADIDDLQPPAGPFVLKPEHGFGGKGVYALIPTDGRLRDLKLGTIRPWGQWVNLCASEEMGWVDGRTPRDQVRGPWFTETLVGDGTRIPDDWNFWVIGGRIALIHRRHWTGYEWTHTCWDESWSPAPNVWPARPMAELPGPRNPDALTFAALKIAARIDGPAIRIDLYEDAEGPIFGEITPYSSAGRNRFTPEWETRLAAYWKD